MLGAVVAVIKVSIFALLCFFSSQTLAAVLPEERVDLLYHAYDGGGVTVDGPSLLVRKNFNEKISVYGNIYEDYVTSASIDVLTSGSEYTEERKEYSAGFDYLNDRTILSLGYTQSTESDYEAGTVSLGVSQEFFGDLTTVTMGYAQGDDTVRSNINENFEEATGRKRFSLGLSQILTRNILISSSFETVFDEGFLNNPYRDIRYRDGTGFTLAPEQYPDTRNSSAFAQRGIAYIPSLDASVRLEYRQYADSWDIKSKNYELRYSQNINSALTVEARVRTYSQNQASFFSDLFESAPIEGQFAGRDKELSQYSANQFGFSVSYTFNSRYDFFNNSSINFSWDRLMFDYDNFRNIETGQPFNVGEEPFYSLESDVIRLFFSSYL